MLMKKAVSDTLATKIWSIAMQTRMSSSQGVKGANTPPTLDPHLDEFSEECDRALDSFADEDPDSLEDLGIPTYLIEDDAVLIEDMEDGEDDQILRFFDVI